MNLEQLYLKFEEGQQLIVVRGLQPGANKQISTNKMSKQLAKNEPCFIFLCDSMKGLHGSAKTRKTKIQKEVQQLTNEFACLRRSAPWTITG
jgi:hypothetical protein